jgi:prolyl oligopeptidase
VLLVLLLLTATLLSRTASAQPPSYPATPRDSVVDEYFGTRIADPYRWLERLDSRATDDWVNAQARLTQEYLGRLPQREAIRRRLTAMWSHRRTEVPWREAGRLVGDQSRGARGGTRERDAPISR